MARVLVIEHNLAARSTIKQLLENHGFQVAVADSPAQGVALLEASPFDVVIINVVMPGGAGLKAVERMRRVSPDVPVVVLYGHAFQSWELAAENLIEMIRMSDTVQGRGRPFRPTDLLDALRRAPGRDGGQPAAGDPREPDRDC